MKNFNDIPIQTPFYIVDESILIDNLKLLKSIMDRADCKILLAQKAFSMFKLYPLIGKYLSGTTASGLNEARLGFYEMGKENHIFSPAYIEYEINEIIEICDHIVFNSINQFNKYKEQVLKKGKKIGLRINPEFSTQNQPIYDPCAYGSRLGITLKNFDEKVLKAVSGLHFHTLCEQNVDDLIATLNEVEKKFGKYFHNIKWINFGGGHHITRDGYDVEKLIKTILDFKAKYKVEVYLEPGEAVVLNAGYFVSSVVDIVKNDIDIAILDVSASCHMPDVLEMPYRPNVINAGFLNEKKYNYKLGSITCLAGDIIGDYSFDKKLVIGDKLVFCDMAHYTMVKNNTFNGVNLPSIAILKVNNEINLVKAFDYTDFKNRLS